MVLCMVQDYVDLVEYLLGNASTTWGAQRISDGHPAPYTNVLAFEIGNEQYVCVGLRVAGVGCEMWCVCVCVPVAVRVCVCHLVADVCVGVVVWVFAWVGDCGTGFGGNCTVVDWVGTTPTGWSRYVVSGPLYCLLDA